ncbi:34884_t:CDS:2, partial [Gigaspora margarita]
GKDLSGILLQSDRSSKGKRVCLGRVIGSLEFVPQKDGMNWNLRYVYISE